MSERVACLLFNLEGPDTLEAVEPFLIKPFSDREIIELPLGAWFRPIVTLVERHLALEPCPA
jgi:ferrochelatase